MSSGGNNACSHLDLSALADKRPLAAAWYREKSGWKLEARAAKGWFPILAVWEAMSGECARQILTTVEAACASDSWHICLRLLHQSGFSKCHTFTFQKPYPNVFSSAAKRRSVCPACTEPRIRYHRRRRSVPHIRMRRSSETSQSRPCSRA